MEINEVLKSRRIELGLTLLQVANAVGVSEATVSRWESGNIANMKRSRIAALANVLKISPTVIMGWSSDQKNSDIIKHNKKVKINILGKVPAGIPMEAVDEIIGEEEIPSEWISGGHEYIALKISGDSMYPKYLDGDIVIIKLQPDCESGQDAVVYVNGYDATLKTVIKQDDGMIRLQPANPEFQPKVFLPENVIILGVVKRLRRDF